MKPSLVLDIVVVVVAVVADVACTGAGRTGMDFESSVADLLGDPDVQKLAEAAEVARCQYSKALRSTHECPPSGSVLHSASLATLSWRTTARLGPRLCWEL